MKETSLNDYRTWMKWLDDEWDVPTLSDHYLMAISQAIWQVQSKDPKSVKLSAFRLSRDGGDGEMTEDQVAANLQITLSIWAGILGGAKTDVDFSKLKLKAW